MTPIDRRTSERRSAADAPVLEERRLSDRRRATRRRSARFPLQIWVEEHRGEDTYFLRVANISAGGLSLDAAMPHPLGAAVTLAFTLPGGHKPVTARGRVANIGGGRAGLGMGIQFTEIEGDGERSVRRCLGV